MFRYIQIVISYCLIISFVSCKQDRSPEEPIDEISIRLSRDPLKINPIFNPSSSAREVFQYIYLPVADFHPESKELYPILIESIPDEIILSEGPHQGNIALDMTFKKESRWSNGDPITAEDYLFTIKSVLLPLSNTAGSALCPSCSE